MEEDQKEVKISSPSGYEKSNHPIPPKRQIPRLPELPRQETLGLDMSKVPGHSGYRSPILRDLGMPKPKFPPEGVTRIAQPESGKQAEKPKSRRFFGLFGGREKISDEERRRKSGESFLDEAVKAIKEGRRYDTRLSGRELSGVVTDVVHGMLSDRKIYGDVTFEPFKIKDCIGKVSGLIKVLVPNKAEVKIKLGFGNNPSINALVLENFDMNAGVLANLSSKFKSTREQVRNVLSYPDKALNNYISTELARRGVRLESAIYGFNNRDFSVTIEGRVPTK